MNGPPAGRVRLRPMRWWDVEPVLAIDRAVFGATAWSAETFWSELARPLSRWYTVAEQAGGDGADGGAQILGYAGLQAGGAAEADVQTLAVAPSAQGLGLGRTLLGVLVDEAVARGATSLLLEVRADNAPAIALYASSGFEQIAVRRRYYQPGDVDALIMRRRPLVPAVPPPAVPLPAVPPPDMTPSDMTPSDMTPLP